MRTIFSLTLLLLVVSSCKKIKQPNVSNGLTNCDCAKEVSADFKIVESATDIASYGQYLSEADTSYTNRNVHFTAFETNASYKWYIGVEQLTGIEVGRYFPNSAVENQTIPITLVVKKKPNKICLPNDDGYDSVVKYIHFKKFPESPGANQPFALNMAGTYRVKMPHLADSQDITITCQMDESNVNKMLTVSNYDGAGANILISSPFPSQGLRLGFRNYSKIELGEPGAYLINYFFGYLQRKIYTNEYTFDVSYGGLNNSDPNYIKRKYYGRKI